MSDGIKYRDQCCVGVLAQYAECAWTVSANVECSNVVAPDGCLDVIYSRAGGLQIVGAMSVRRDVLMTSQSVCSGLRFRPGLAWVALGVRPAELTDRVMAASDIWPRRAREIENRLADQQDSASWPGLLQNAFAEPARPREPWHEVFAEISRRGGQVDLSALARSANMSQRQFRRRCLEDSGLSPKHLCRVLRFRRLRERALALPRPSWTELALDTGYFDQAHMIRDFREFMGGAPVSVLSNSNARQAA